MAAGSVYWAPWVSILRLRGKLIASETQRYNEFPHPAQNLDPITFVLWQWQQVIC